MKKLVVPALVVIGGVSYMKLPMDGHMQSTGLSLPSMNIGPVASLTGLISWMLPGQSSAATNLDESINGNTARGIDPGLSKGAEPRIPPELMRFMNPSLLTNTPTGTQDLSPEARVALQRIMVQARANPTAFKEQLAAMTKTSHGQQ
jgi:hypothetical protein